MGPKVEAACEFARATGGRAVIASSDEALAALAGDAGTTVTVDADGIEAAERAEP